MGYDLTLIATPSTRLEALLRAAGLKVSENLAVDGETLLSIGKVGTYAVFWRDNHVSPISTPIDFQKLSDVAPLLVLDIVDAAGGQGVAYYDNGTEIWSVSFSADDADFLVTTGEIPVDMERLTREAASKANASPGEETVLYADQTPALIFLELTGFGHDQSDRSKFRVVEGDFVSAKKWWKFW